MSRLPKPLDVSFLTAHGYNFGGKVNKNSMTKVMHGEVSLACKILSRKKNLTEDNDRLEVLKKISHPQIIGIHSVAQNSNYVFVFMPWTDEGNLLTHIKQYGMVKESTANLWFYQLVCAIKYLHSMNYAHCNLSCECVLMSKTNVKLSGTTHVQRCLKGEKVKIKNRKSIAAFYLPPEMKNGSSCDPLKGDIFALGTILFMMLNAMVPFNISESFELIDDQMNRRIQMRPSNVGKLSLDCQVMILTLLEPKAEIRWNIEKIYGMKWIEKFVDKCQGDS